MFITMLLTSLALERPWEKFGGTTYFDTWGDGLKTLAMALLGAFFAIAMVMCEFWLIMKSNAIVLMIGGVCKEMITISVGVLAFGDVLNGINLAGFFIVFSGVVLYKVSHHLAKMEAKAEGLVEDDMAEVGGGKSVNYAHVQNADSRENGKGAEHGDGGFFTIGDDDDDFVVDESSNGTAFVDETTALGDGEDFADNGEVFDGVRPMEISKDKKKHRIGGLITAARRGKDKSTEEETGEFKDPKERIV